MKKFITLIACASALLMLGTSCKKVSGADCFGIVTVKGTSDEQCTIQLDEQTVLIPDNLTKNPYEVETRAFCRYIDKGYIDASAGTKSAQVIWTRKILTKAPVLTAGEQDPELYGNTPIEIYKSWTTLVEDGYINLNFTARWNNPSVAHTLNLVKGTDPSNPLLFVFRHNNNEDVTSESGYWRDGNVAFNIKDLLPAGSASYDISVKYLSHSGEKTITFTYKPGEKNSRNLSNVIADEQDFIK